MDNQTYLREKQNFYANLNGTTFNEMLNLIFSFSLINFFGALVKILLLKYHFDIFSKFW